MNKISNIHKLHFNFLQKRAAFTLAEVLITLGIIGVVAAITLPTLINKIQDRQNIAKWKKEYSTLSNAFQSLINDGAPFCKSYYYETCNVDLEEFANSMKEKLKIVSECGSHTNMPNAICDMDIDYSKGEFRPNRKYPWVGISGNDTRSFYKPLGGTKYFNNYNFGNYVFLLNDGAAVYFGGSHGGPWIVVDVNNFSKGPNVFGRDVFILRIVSDRAKNVNKLLPLGAEGTYNKNYNGETCECSKDKGNNNNALNYIAGQQGNQEVISGGCCSASYLLK